MLLCGESYHFTPRKGNFQDVKAIVLRRKSYAFTAFLENFTFSRAVHFTVFRIRPAPCSSNNQCNPYNQSKSVVKIICLINFNPLLKKINVITVIRGRYIRGRFRFIPPDCLA